MRRRGWAALETLTALLPEPSLEADVLETLERDELIALVRACLDLGWRSPAPSE